MAERHDYEFAHYQTPLLGSYQHYLFSFHDEFVEAIAQGIWLDQPEHPTAPPTDHPLAEFPQSVAAESYLSRSGRRWELRRTMRDAQDLLLASNLCSQRLYQFNIVLEDRSSPGAGVFLRTRQGVTRTRMARDWVGVVAERDSLADVTDF